jgi:two-component system, cell cycle sensor histidine kinase and response regulator CckA
MGQPILEDAGHQKLKSENPRRVFKNHIQGAFLRSAAGGIIWVCTFAAYWFGAVEHNAFIKASIALGFLVVMNIPLLLIVRHIRLKILHEIIFIITHAFEITAYIGFIYFVGGLSASFLTTIFIALIFFVGVMAPMRHPFIVAGLCSLAFNTMAILEYLNIIPYQNAGLWNEKPHLKVVIVLPVITAIFFVIALMAAYTAQLLKTARARLKEKNLDLEITNDKLLKEVEERIRVETALRKSEQKLQRIFDNVPDALYTHDLDGNILEINKGIRKSLGYGDDAYYPLKANIRDLMPEKYRSLFHTYIADVMQKGRSEGLVSLMTRDGIERVFEYRNILISDEQGNPLGAQGSARDITERLTSEREKKRLHEQLQRAQKMEAIGLLAGGVAHDLNNILSGLVSYPDLLLTEIPEDSRLRKPLSTIKQSGEKAASIVQDLLTLARRGVSVSQVVNMNRIIRDYLNSLEHGRIISMHPNIKMAIHLDPDLMNIVGSQVHLLKTVMNLVLNAAESMPDGGIITVSTENRTLESPVTGYDAIEKGDYVVVSIQDNGIGLSEKDHQRIFEPFYTKKALGRSGTGLGLSVVWGTVQDHKGYIEVHSEPGKGAAFIMYLPATREELEQEDNLISIELYKGKGEKILVVDDVDEQREIAAKILESLGYQVHSVSCGENALEYLMRHKADLLVLDMIMTGIDGLETYKHVLEMNPGQKAVIVSGYSETERVKEALSIGASTYIKKPYTLQKIAFAVREALFG